MSVFTTPTKKEPRVFSAADVLHPNEEWDPSNASIETYDLSKWEHDEDKYCVVLRNIASNEECQNLINMSEEVGFEPAEVNVGNGKQMLLTDVRNNDRCIYDHSAITEQIWQRVLRALDGSAELKHRLLRAPWTENGFRYRAVHAVGLNERMRILRYDKGTYFAPHYDGTYVRNMEAGLDRKGEVSFVTFQLYLNEGCGGGTTRFLARGRDRNGHMNFVDVMPKIGSVLLFQHDCYHEGAKVTSGRKYVIRSDVMYTTKGPGWEYAVKPLPTAAELLHQEQQQRAEEEEEYGEVEVDLS